MSYVKSIWIWKSCLRIRTAAKGWFRWYKFNSICNLSSIFIGCWLLYFAFESSIFTHRLAGVLRCHSQIHANSVCSSLHCLHLSERSVRTSRRTVIHLFVKSCACVGVSSYPQRQVVMDTHCFEFNKESVVQHCREIGKLDPFKREKNLFGVCGEYIRRNRLKWHCISTPKSNSWMPMVWARNVRGINNIRCLLSPHTIKIAARLSRFSMIL